jgi:polysaccharide biosynthesis/export protein
MKYKARGFFYPKENMINKNEFFIVIYLILVALLTACVKPKSSELPMESHLEEAVLEGPSQTTSSFGTPDYLLGPEDVLDVLVWKNADLSRTVSVRPDGKISLPLIGDVQAAGLTSSKLRDSIEERLREYKETPGVSIIIREVNSFSVFVLGEVVRPGKFQLRSETTLLQALTLSGGFTQYAGSDRIILLRRIAGRETRRQIRFSDIVNGKDPDANVVLQPGDTIVVP